MIFDRDNWQEIFIALKSNRLRTALTAFGVFWGVFMLIVLIGSGKGLYLGVTQEFSRFATNSVVIWPRQTTQSYKGFNRGRQFTFNNGDIYALKESLEHAKYIAPRIQLGGHHTSNTATRGSKSGEFSIFGDFPDVIHIQLLNIHQGRFINDLDIEQKRKVAIIGDRVRKILFEPEEDPVGKYIGVNGVYFKVVGLFISSSTGDDAERDETTIFLPFTSFQQAYNYKDYVGYFALNSVQGVHASVLKEEAVEILAHRHHVAPDDEMAFGFWDLETQYNKINDLFKGINGLNWFVGVISLVAGVIGVSNIMLIIVKERTKEIGIKRALGATPFTITTMIVMETVFLTTVSGYVGLFTGVGLLELISYLIEASGGLEMFKNPSVDFEIALTAFGILLVSGIVAGLIPAKKALEVSPVDAIRIGS